MPVKYEMISREEELERENQFLREKLIHVHVGRIRDRRTYDEMKCVLQAQIEALYIELRNQRSK